jgi:peptidoglycan/LPS O-acetylase OafA/YrhL
MATNKPEKSHIVSIDLLRGLLAISIMLYHILYSERIFIVERVAYYAVYGFFVISGFSLYYVYKDRFQSVFDFFNYLIRRYFRIWPLYALVCTLQLLLFTPGGSGDLSHRIAVNYSLLFGFTDAGATSMVRGGWSIGIEFVFYFLFPFVVLFARASISKLLVLTVLSGVTSIWFINHIIDSTSSMRTLWVPYTQPQSFIVYFIAGCLFAEIYLRISVKFKGHWSSYAGIVLSLIPFFLIGIDNTLELLVGWKGGLLMASTLGLVLSTAFVREDGKLFRMLADLLGKMSYSIYLLHPLVYAGLRKMHFPAGFPIMLATIVLSFAAAIIVYKLVENPIRNFGKALTNSAKPLATSVK